MNSAAPVPHVSLMMDTFIANSDVEDLRAICRALLVVGPPNTSTTFRKVVKQRLRRSKTSAPLPSSSSLYTPASDRVLYSSSSSASSDTSLPSAENSSTSFTSSKLKQAESLSATASDPLFTSHARKVQSQARALFGAGLALDSLPLLTVLVRGTSNLSWSEEGAFVDTLAILDGDIAQAVQSTHEEISSVLHGMSEDEVNVSKGLRNVDEIREALQACAHEVESRGDEFPFQRGLANVEWLQTSDVWTRALARFALRS